MKYLSVITSIICLVMLGGCQLVGDIFKAGVWAGVLLVIVIVGLLIFILGKIFGSK